jgi:hypothetical protein
MKWTARRKVAVVLAVTSGRLAMSEVCRRYRISVDEFVEWQRQVRGGLWERWTGAARR